MSENKIDTQDRELIFTRSFKAPRELVWQAWTDPQHVVNWWGPKGFTNTIHEMDVRPGGLWRLTMHGPDGTDYPNRIEFLEVVKPERLVYHHGDDNNPQMFHVTTHFIVEGDQTKIVSRMLFKTAAECAETKKFALEGHKTTMDRLAEQLDALQTADREFRISRTFDAPREMVWQAMTDPQHVVKWWGPRGFSATIEKMDFRVGGIWKQTLHGPDGANYLNEHVFQEIVEPERIVMSHGGHKEGGSCVRSMATWTFDVVEETKTKVTLRMVFPSASERDRVVREFGAIEGGKQTLERLGEQLAKQPVVVERTFNAPMATVWEAITNPIHMKQWYIAELESFKPEAGFKTQMDVAREGNNYLRLWEVTEAEAGKKIAYTWKYEGHPGESLLTMELFADGGKTRLKVTHAGLETFLPEVHPKHARGNFIKGWGHLVRTLSEHLAKMAPIADRTVIITRMFDAPRELVWQAWTDPQLMAQWWGPRGFTNPVCEMDVQPGGIWRVVMRSPEGEEFPLKSVYVKVEPPERLVLVMDCSEHSIEWHDLVNPNRDKSKPPRLDCVQTVTFEDVAGKTKLTIRTELETVAIRDTMLKMGMHEGWSGSLDRLTECLLQTA